MVIISNSYVFDVDPADKVFKQKVSVRPIAHYCEKYTKWSCPICEQIAEGFPNFSDDMLFKNFSFPEGTERCPVCGINLNWNAPRYACKISKEPEEYVDETTNRNSR